MASSGGFGGVLHMFSYAVSKAAVSAFTRPMAKELASRYIRINTLCPSTIFLEMIPRGGEFTQSTHATIPMGRDGKPRETGKLMIFLPTAKSPMSMEPASFVDGGMIA